MFVLSIRMGGLDQGVGWEDEKGASARILKGVGGTCILSDLIAEGIF